MAQATRANTIQDAVKEQEADKYTHMKAGEYMVHVFVETTRGLVNPTDIEGNIDAIITIECFDKKKYSPVKKGLHTAPHNWNEHFFWNKVVGSSQEAEQQRVKITVSNHKFIGADATLGSIELDFSTIYASENHCILHRWAALANLEKNFQKILGFIKFSVSVVTEGDATTQLKSEDLGGFDQQNIIMPPFMEKKLYQITIDVIRGEQIKKMDTWGGSVDPFLKFKLGAVKLETDVVMNNINPKWNQTIKIPVAMPTITDYLTIELFDYDKLKASELIGTSQILIKDIEEGKYQDFEWKSFYSCPPGASGKYANLMNTIPDLASHWCGRINLRISITADPNAKAEKVAFTDAKTIDSLDKQPRLKYELKADVHYAMNLPENNKKYSIRIRWAQNETKTKEIEVPRGRMAEFYQTVTPIVTEFGNKTIEGTPDVIIYLLRGDKHISFIRVPASYFMEQDKKAEIFYFKIDKSISDVRDDLAGVVKLRVWIHSLATQVNLAVGGWDKPLVKKPEMKKWKIIVNLYQAMDLISADDNGSSDPICEIYFAGFIFKSPPLMNTLNPIWNYRMEFRGEFDDVKECPPFLLDMWDYDEFSSNDYLGGAVLKINDECFGKTAPVRPKWYPLKYGAYDKDFGKVLISFNVYPENTQIIPYGDIDPPTTKYHLNMKVLGVRGLKSLGVLDVKKPFIKFDLNSTRSAKKRQAVEEKKFVQTQPQEKGPDANILTVINLDLDLPNDPLYCPSLSCRVHDFYLRGMAQPLLGTFSIPLSNFLERMTQRQLEKKAKDQEKTQTPSLVAPASGSSFVINTQFKDIASGAPLKQLEKSVEVDDDDDEEEKTNLLDSQKKKILPALKSLNTNLDGSNSPNSPSGALKINLDDQKLLKSMFSSVEKKLFPYPLDKVALKPEYEWDKVKGYHKEINAPDKNIYIELGYDSKNRREKHYRYVIDKPLEETDFIDRSPFDEIDIKRGSQVDDDKIFSKIFKGKKDQTVEESETVGRFKAMITIMTEDEKKHSEHFAIKSDGLKAKDAKEAKVTHIKDCVIGIPDLDFLKKADCVVRCFVLNATNLAAKDEDSNSDPYLKVQLGDKIYNQSKDFQEDEPNPNFYKLFEFPCTIPGAGLLKVSVMDKDDFARDDLIGETLIDIEDRWFSKRFRQLLEVPVETRKLYNPESRLSQGELRLFVDIIPREENILKKKWDIVPKPKQPFELRVIIWDVEGLPITDSSGQIDIYITAKLDDGRKLSTDTHWASRNGNGSFNWRMVFPVEFPLKSNRIVFQAWDKDIISADDHIAEVAYDFTEEAIEAFMYEQTTRKFDMQSKSEKFEVELYRADEKDPSKLVKSGKLRASLQLVPKQQAILNPAGQGRSDPNSDPFLAPPIGRLKFSLNPLDMWEIYVGPVYRQRVYMFCAAALCIVILVLSFPQILVAMLGRIFF